MNRRKFSWLAQPHHTPRTKRVVQPFISGAASQCGKAGQQWDPGEKVELFQSNPGVVMPNPWRSQQ